ncbi:DUF1176 domain-containing protein, partial [Stenotrophomonas sp. SrG]|uniref:DUF1176 domain-containing protein n=1 Tax=Stenotrophomonas sp. SrG TaxID=3414430 RepID=UPI003CF59749
YWVVNDHAPYPPAYIPHRGVDADALTISSSHKGRGLGDCWSSASGAWNGAAYVKTSDSTTGLCRRVAAGGAWDLPTL